MNKKIVKLDQELINAEGTLFCALEKLKGYGKDCKCDMNRTYRALVCPNGEIITFCLDCGGTVELSE